MAGRILVTGHEGYIGAVLVPKLLERGYDVLGLDTGFFAECRFGDEPELLDDHFRALRLDIRDVRTEMLAGVDAVLHLAALSNDPLGMLDPTLTGAINHRASVSLATYARDAGVRRFIFSSSCSLYGAAATDVPLDETAEMHPVTAYGESKRDAEAGISALARADFSPTFLRNATAYGPSPRLRGDLVVNDLVARALVDGQIELKSDGSPWRPIVHVEDIADAFIAVLEAPVEAVHNESFNVGVVGENYRIVEIAQIVQKAVSGSAVTLAAGASPDARTYRVDFSKIARLVPGFQPRWGLAEGVAQLRDTYKHHGVDLGDLFGPRFTRLERLRQLMGRGELDLSMRWRATAASVR